MGILQNPTSRLEIKLLVDVQTWLVFPGGEGSLQSAFEALLYWDIRLN